MGVVQKQSIRIAFITYFGILIGALNTMFILPRVLGAEKTWFSNAFVISSNRIYSIPSFGSPECVDPLLPIF